ncbi:MAG: hypothetical protein WBP94_05670 [Rhodomicrobiaceae bacterium]
MASIALVAEMAAISGDPARASMPHALIDGRALTAAALAKVAAITPRTAVGLPSVEKPRRGRYHRLATPS